MALKGVLRCLPHLKALSRARTSHSRREILKKCPKKCVYYAISEVVKNFLNGNIRMPTRKIVKLRKYKAVLRELGKKTTSLQRREKIINQRGGFLPTLLTSALSLLPLLLR